MYFILLLLVGTLCAVSCKDEVSTFHYTNDGELIYYQGYSTKTLNYTEAVDFCHLMGGTLPTSFEHIFPLVLSSFRHDSDLFWLGPVRQTNKTDYIWPNGVKFVYNELLTTNKDCSDGRCCAVAAKWTSSSGSGRHLNYVEKSCYLIHHPVCLIKNSLGHLSSKVDQIASRHKVLSDELFNLSYGEAEPAAARRRSKREAKSYIKDEASGKVYYYDSSVGTYDESVEFCKNNGGILTSIANKEEALFLTKILGRFRDAWLGSTKSILPNGLWASKKYAWLDGSSFNSDLWNIRPSTDAQYALSLSSYTDYYGQIREVPCDRSNRRICLMNPVTASPPLTTIVTTIATSPRTTMVTRTTPAPSPPPSSSPPRATTTTSSVSTFAPGTGVDEKLDAIASRMERQEKLLYDLIKALKSAFNAV